MLAAFPRWVANEIRWRRKYFAFKSPLSAINFEPTLSIKELDRTVLTDIHIKHNRPDIIILNKQQNQALLDIAVPNSHDITQTYNTKINKYLELSVAVGV
jgi:hypothetical protein